MMIILITIFTIPYKSIFKIKINHLRWKRIIKLYSLIIGKNNAIIFLLQVN